MKIIWMLVNCNTEQEATKIGKLILRARLASCFDMVPRLAAYYFWPPRKNRIEKTKGCILILETMPPYVKRIEMLVKNIHSDALPFTGSIGLNDVNPAYIRWMKKELTK
ncbi:divalent-cation tolerance protein CutA [Candidatus Jorgensenbacteria bacterium]|nr:divalent-cation tolerance protein CutA [Candidatus Jorgensenbacteria bacterium]